MTIIFPIYLFNNTDNTVRLNQINKDIQPYTYFSIKNEKELSLIYLTSDDFKERLLDSRFLVSTDNPVGIPINVYSSLNAVNIFSVYKALESAGGGGGDTTLQQAYENSTNPEITTNSSLGALTIKRGSSSDNDNVLEIKNGAGVTVTNIDGFGNIKSNNNVITKDSTGFFDNDNIVITGDPINRTIILTGTVQAYFQGVPVSLFSSGYVSPQHGTDVNQKYFLSYDGTSVSWNTIPWTFDKLQIAVAFYDTVNTSWRYIRETHGLMPWTVHQELHETLGTYKQSGGDITGFTLNSTTVSNRRPDISTCYIKDEDIITINSSLTSKLYTQFYLSGSSTNNFLLNKSDIVPLLTNQPYYNQFTGGVWQQTLVPSNNYMSVWLLEMPMAADSGSQSLRHVFIQGQSVSTTLAAEQAKQSSSVNIGAINTQENIFIGKIILRFTGGNWIFIQVDLLTGNRVNQSSSTAGNFLTGVVVDTTLIGNGTAINPLGINLANPNTWTEAQTFSATTYFNGDIIQNGGAYDTHAEQVYTKDNLIITRDGAISGLGIGEYTGFQAKLYDGVNDGQLVFDKDGWARVGDVGNLRKIATIEESSFDGGIAYYDQSSLSLKTTMSPVISTIYGSSAASGNLTLSSTSHATKGNILFGSSSYDEVKNILSVNGTSGSIIGISNVKLAVNNGYYEAISTAGPIIAFGRNDSGTIVGRRLGGVYAYAKLPVGTYNNSARIDFTADGTVTDTSAPGRITFSTTISGSLGSSERMRISHNGYLGLYGITDPQTPFHVKTRYSASSPGNGAIRIENYTDTLSGMIDNISGLNIRYKGIYDVSGSINPESTAYSQITLGNGVINFYANTGLTAGTSFTPTSRMVVNTTGVGIGITPTELLQVVDTNSQPYPILTVEAPTNSVFIGSALGSADAVSTKSILYITNTGANGITQQGELRFGLSPARTPASITTKIEGTYAKGSLVFNTKGIDGEELPTEKMRITGSGSLFLGTTLGYTKGLLSLLGSTVSTDDSYATIVGGTSEGATTNQSFRIATAHFTRTSNPVALIGGSNVDTPTANNMVLIGGGYSGLTSATEIQFYTASNTTTASGTERMVITSDGHVGINQTTLLDAGNGNAHVKWLTLGGSGVEIGQSYGVLGLMNNRPTATLGNSSGEIAFYTLNNKGTGVATYGSRNVASINAILSGVGGTTAGFGGDLVLYTKSDNISGVVERMRISNTGNVGIGGTGDDIGVFGNYKTLEIHGSGASSVESCGVIELVNNRTTVAAGDSAGYLVFASLNNGAATNTRQVAAITTAVVGTTVGNRGGDLIFKTKTDNNAATDERMRITSDGLVNIVGLTASQLVATDATKNLTSLAYTTTPTASNIPQWDANKNLSADNFIEGYTTTVTAAGTTTLTVASTYQQEFTGTTTQTVKLPTTGVVAGQSFVIINSSTGAVTVQSSAANTIMVLAGGYTATLVSKIATPTTAANWSCGVNLIGDLTTKILVGGGATNSPVWTVAQGSGAPVRATSPALTTPTVVTSIVGGATFAAFNTVSTILSIGGAATTLTIGGTPTTAITHNYSTNATTGASVIKAINFGTAGASGSITNITIGSAVSGSTTNNTINGIITNAYTRVLAVNTVDSGSFIMTPAYTGAFTLDRHNYIQLNNPTSASTLTDAPVFSFNAAIGTHKSVATGTTKASIGTTQAWIKVNINGTLHYIPAYQTTS